MNYDFWALYMSKLFMLYGKNYFLFPHHPFPKYGDVTMDAAFKKILDGTGSSAGSSSSSWGPSTVEEESNLLSDAIKFFKENIIYSTSNNSIIYMKTE